MQSSVWTEWTVTTLRELFSISRVFLLPAIIFLFARFIYIRWKYNGRRYSNMSRPIIGLGGLAMFVLSDWIRSGAVLAVSHYPDTTTTYMIDTVSIVAAFIISTFGILFFIRHFTPDIGKTGARIWWGGQRLWVAATIGCTFFVAIHYAFFH